MDLHVMKNGFFKKASLVCMCVLLTFFLVNTFLKINIENKVLKQNINHSGKNKMKYILRWTPSNTIPFVYLGEGQQGFIERTCSYTSCFVTDDRNYLGDLTKFDVIAFAGPQLLQMKRAKLPEKRSPHQKYVFASLESPVYYPLCSKRFDNYFNWTWTYKLNSDAKWGYIVIKDAHNNEVGPRIDMNWIKFEDMDPVSDELKEQIKTKTKAAAWFVSNCHSKGRRENFVNKLQQVLQKYDLTIDIYGICGPLSCQKDKGDECNKLLREDYYFYLSFENSLSEDYVTEKLLTSLNYHTVPIVYGGANYTRFMPDGIYLNARELGVEKLAAKMNQLIKNPGQYAEYFRWHKYYSYHDSGQTSDFNDYCRFCAMLFDDNLVNKTTIYHDFSNWWDSKNGCQKTSVPTF